MDQNNNLQNRRRELGVFLGERFVVVIFFIYVCEQLATLFYRACLFPIIRDVLQVNAISFQGDSILSIFSSLLSPLWNVLSKSLPVFLQNPLSDFIKSHASDAMFQAPDFISQYGELMIQLYYTTIIVLLILQLIMSIVPYVISGWWYIRCIRIKMDELRREDARLKEEFDKRRNLLFSDITHDIKTPITSIVGYSRALSDGMVKDPEKQQEYLHSIYSKSLRISELITMLFEFVKLDSDGFKLHKETLDMAELVRENVIMLLSDFDETGIDLDIDIPEDVCLVDADRVQLSRVVTNLLTNAIRYIHTGHQVQVLMHTVQVEGQDFYRLSVADDGLPIEEDFAKTIFDPFSRSDAARQTTSGGSGLGLSIAHKVAGLHGGELSLDLHYGNGYEKAFVLLVPVLKEVES